MACHASLSFTAAIAPSQILDLLKELGMAHVCLLKMDIASQLHVSNTASPTPLAQEGAEQETSAVASEHILDAGPACDVPAAAAARCRSIWRARASTNRGKFREIGGLHQRVQLELHFWTGPPYASSITSRGASPLDPGRRPSARGLVGLNRIECFSNAFACPLQERF